MALFRCGTSTALPETLDEIYITGWVGFKQTGAGVHANFTNSRVTIGKNNLGVATGSAYGDTLYLGLTYMGTVPSTATTHELDGESFIGDDSLEKALDYIRTHAKEPVNLS